MILNSYDFTILLLLATLSEMVNFCHFLYTCSVFKKSNQTCPDIGQIRNKITILMYSRLKI